MSYVASCPACVYGLWTNGPGGLRQVIRRDMKTAKVEPTVLDIPKRGQDISGDKGPRLEDLVKATSESLNGDLRNVMILSRHLEMIK